MFDWCLKVISTFLCSRELICAEKAKVCFPTGIKRNVLLNREDYGYKCVCSVGCLLKTAYIKGIVLYQIILFHGILVH